MISVDEALALLEQHRPDFGTETVSLEDANGRVLDADVVATFSQPPAPTSIMDGFAFRKEDLNQTLKVVGESRAGRPYNGVLGAGEAVRIFTGAHLPSGANHVEIQEYAERNEAALHFPKVSKGRDYIRPAGSDFKSGDMLFRAGQSISPAVISALASANVASVRVKRTPHIAILRCGDELRPVGSVLNADQIIDSNGPFLMSLLSQWGVHFTDLGLVPDDPEAIRDEISKCDADIIIPIGGASVGDYDFMKSVFLDVGFKPIFDKVAVKPGKPVWCSRRSEQIVLGLPGNPHSVWLCAYLFLSHLLGRAAKWQTYRLKSGLAANGVRERFIRGVLDQAGEVTPLNGRTGFALSMAKATLFIRRAPMAKDVAAGDVVQCLQITE